MVLFSKNKPTQRVELEGAWVELQCLSKGVKDDLQNKLLEAVKNVDVGTIKQLEQNSNEIPENLPFEIVGKINEINYYALSKAIKAWSEPQDVTYESVKDLDEDVFEKILLEVNKMNNLELGERKN